MRLDVTQEHHPGETHGVRRPSVALDGAPRVKQSVAPQYAPLDRCIQAAYDWAFRSPYSKQVWHEFKFGGLPCGGHDQ